MNRLEMFNAMINRLVVRLRAKPFSQLLGDVNTENWYDGMILGMEDLFAYDKHELSQKTAPNAYFFKVLMYNPTDQQHFYVVVRSPREGGL